MVRAKNSQSWAKVQIAESRALYGFGPKRPKRPIIFCLLEFAHTPLRLCVSFPLPTGEVGFLAFLAQSRAGARSRRFQLWPKIGGNWPGRLKIGPELVFLSLQGDLFGCRGAQGRAGSP